MRETFYAIDNQQSKMGEIKCQKEMGQGLRQELRGQEMEEAGVKVGRPGREPDQGQAAIKETVGQIEARRQKSEVGDQKSEVREIK